MALDTGEMIAIAEFASEPKESRQKMTRIAPVAIDPSNSSFKGQVVLITGGGSGLGRAYARAMAKLGMCVAIASRNLHKLEETRELIRQDGGNALALTMDITDPASITSVVDTVESQLGTIDILVNNAGIGGPIKPWWEAVNSGEWEEAVRVNYQGAFYCTGVVCERMHKRNHGRIINIASSTVESRPDCLAAYAYSKWLVVEMTRQAAKTLGESGISIFAVHPGTVRTAMTEAMLSNEHKGKLPLLEHIFETHKDVSADVAVELVLYIASGAVDNLSGQFLCRKEGTVVQCNE